MLDLDGGHLHQVGKKVSSPDGGRVLGRLVVLADVLSLELPGKVHRQEPPGEAAEKREGVTDHARTELPQGEGARAELRQEPADFLAMDPLIPLDLENHFLFVRISGGAGVPLVGEGRRLLARVGELKQTHQPLPGLLQRSHRLPFP